MEVGKNDEATDQIATMVPEKPTEMWYNFQVVNPTCAILRGTLSTTDKRFKIMSRGRQESSAAAVAVVCGHLFQSPDWTSGGVDKVLEYGDRVFRASHARCKLPDDAYLTTNLLQNEFFVGDYKCLIATETSVVTGNLFTESPSSPNLVNGVPKFFAKNDYGILTTQGMYVAIWKHATDGFFCFDPAPTDEQGKRCIDGVACLIRSQTVDGILSVFCENLNPKLNSRYGIDRVRLIKVKSMNGGPSEIMKSSGSVNLRPSQLVLDKRFQSVSQIQDEDNNNRYDHKQLSDSTLSPTIPEEDDSSTSAESSMLRIDMTNNAIEAKFAKVPFSETSFKSSDSEPLEDHLSYGRAPETLRVLASDPNIAILHGWTHAYSESYKAQGAQMSANCVMAVAYKRLHPVKTWNRETIDEILTLGSVVYEEARSFKPTIKRMTTADLNEFKFKIDGKKQIIDSDLMTIVGTYVSKNPAVINLKIGLEEFFLKNTDGILESEPNTVALWLENGYYYVFDSAQCDFNGMHLKTSKPSEKIPIGKSCVMRFTSQSLLLNRLMSNLDASQNFSRYSIKRIGILDDVPGMRDWYYYKAGELGKNWILCGTINDEDDSIKSHGKGIQGLAISIAALVTLEMLEPRKWYKNDVDDIIREGDAYYQWCIPPSINRGVGEHHELTLNSLKKYMYYKKRKVEVQLKEFVLFGEIDPSPESEELDITTAVIKYLDSYEAGIIEANKKFFAIWRHEEILKDGNRDMGFYMFIPKPTESFMSRFQKVDSEDPVSVACVIRFQEKEELCKTLKELFLSDRKTAAKNEFAIHDIKPGSIGGVMTDEDIEKDKDVPVMPDLRNYVRTGNHGAVLIGSYVQSDESIFKRDTRDKQQAANALVALTMAQLFNPHLWNLEVIDDIIRIGNKMTRENLRNIPEDDDGTKRDYLVPSEISPKFNIGVNQIVVTVMENTIKGKLGELDKFLEDFFARHTKGIFRKKEIMMPIWKEEATNTCFVFDPRGMETGYAAVYWFLDLYEMSTVMVKCTGKERGGFTIDNISIRNSIEESERIAEEYRELGVDSNYYKFKFIEGGVWKIDCEISLKDEKFPVTCRGKQSAAVCVMAIVFSKVYEPPSWRKEIISEVVAAGSKLHIRSAERLQTQDILRPRDICPDFYLANRKINLMIQEFGPPGKILSHEKYLNLDYNMRKFLAENTSGCLTIGDKLNFALWKFQNYIYLFEPGDTGLMRFEKVDFAIQMLEKLGNLNFEITTVDTSESRRSSLVKGSSIKIKMMDIPQDTNLFEPLPDNKGGILRGSTHQTSEVMADGTRGRQTASNCVIALAMALIKDPIKWTKKNLDDILVEGIILHRDSNKLTNKLTILKPIDLVRIFKLDDKIFMTDIQSDAVTGVLTCIEGDDPKLTRRRSSSESSKKSNSKNVNDKNGTLEPMSLEYGVKTFFQKYNSGIFVSGRFMVSIWKSNGLYFLYDPMPRNSQGLKAEPDDAKVASCLLHSSNIESIAETIRANIPGTVKFSFYEICSVVLKVIPPEPFLFPLGYKPQEDKLMTSSDIIPSNPTIDTESYFQRIDKEMSIMISETHLNSDIFAVENRGFQSTAVAVVAVVASMIHAPSAWTPSMIDIILKAGDKLHTECASVYNVEEPRNLTTEEIFDVFLLGDVRARIKICRNFSTGTDLELDLRDSLETFFDKNNAGIMYTNDCTIALMKHWEKYYILDPTDNNKIKNFDYNSACLVECENVSKLSKVIINVFDESSTVFSLNVIRILDLQFYSQ